MIEFLTAVSTIAFLLWIAARIVLVIRFDRNVKGHLKQAAYANTVGDAVSSFEVAVQYLETTDRTEGHTSVLWRTPSEDVGLWFLNLSNLLNELCLSTTNSNPTLPEQADILMGFYAILLNERKSGSTKIIAPGGITVFPHNTAFALWGFLSFLFCLAGWVIIIGF